ncbi:MAG: hypothetical protein EP330_14995 [Deltaproteobacteria bacterium]|nr:MAG: hypothetical protein EP330_14995 [Deltaproteobacteria bacterium]
MLVLLALLAHAESPRLGTEVRPTHMAVDLTVDPAEDVFSGTVTLDLAIDDKRSAVTLHAEEMTVTDATFVWKGKKRVPATVTLLEGGQARFDASKPLKPGAWQLEVTYEGTVHTQPYGLYRFEHQDEPYLVTQLEADDARTVWPSFDEPGFKVSHELTIKAPDGQVVIANGPALEATSSGGWTTHRFAATPPIPTYAGALAVGPYALVEVEAGDVPVRIAVPKGQEPTIGPLAEEIPQVLDTASEWFGGKYPYAKLDFVVVPSFAFGAMENPGAIVMNGSLIPEPGRETPGQRYQLSMVVGHEVAHMWFGNLVTMAWWDDFWLNESFASWAGERIAQTIHPELERHLRAPGKMAGMLRADGAATTRQLRTDVDPGAIFETANFAVYGKGEALLDHMEAWLGAAVYQQGVRDYLSQRQWGNAEAADLFAALEKASGKPVGEVLQPYLDHPGAPLVTLSKGDDGAWTATQTRYALNGVTFEEQTLWPVVLMLRVGRADGSVDLVPTRIDGAETTLDLGEASWVHPAGDGVGYYVWRLNDPAREALLANVDKLSVREKLSLLAMGELEVSAGTRTPASLLPLVSTFAEETHPLVLGEVASLSGYIQVVDNLDDVPEETLAKAKAWMRETQRPLLDTIGMEAREDEPQGTVGLRQGLLLRLAWAEDAEVIAYLKGIAEANLADPMAGDPQLTRIAWMVYVKDAGPELQQTLLDKAHAAELPAMRGMYMQLAGSVRGEATRKRALELAIAPEATMNDTFALYGGASAGADNDKAIEEELFQWALDHHDALAAKMPPQMRMYLAGVGGCELSRVEKAKAFYLDPARKVQGVERVLAESEARVKQCIADRELRGPSVLAFIEAWTPTEPAAEE